MRSEQQVETRPDWMTYMRRGQFEEAWKFSDEVLQSRAGTPCWHLPRHLQYVWDGSSPEGKRVLVRCYHGLGDTIQFIRFMPMLKSVAKEVIVWAQPDLIPLLQTAPGIDQLLPLHNGSPEVAYDMDVEIMELSHLFRTNINSLPAAIPYLHVHPTDLPGKNGFSVGLVWKAGDWDQRRGILFQALSPLAEIPGVDLYILQGGAADAGWREGFGINPGSMDLFNYARFIRSLDILITVDSMPAHLAGAIGTPVWNLLHTKADWRWMDDREDSPWYPTMRIFRQRTAGDWDEVISRVKVELDDLSSKAY
ncbi:ADP-heptose--LPS heptosyltransferase [Segetibacter sp. 3557_3]|uniref:ADP-heptose--LPS heptosyltransferase n=1 Tax=Segetibacter sp. 3557_3 TaxID=2547429 RepID=UPI00105880CF|nr:ADP-heptose--LPS heptosyltransferase [Segetibacter sp. 3557_3]TDH25259.1 ADP-heptose--LPS heptosyltransferase [Segetibacter sp. 3557_3]